MKCFYCGKHLNFNTKERTTIKFDRNSQKYFCSSYCLKEWNEEKRLARLRAQKAEKAFREQRHLEIWTGDD